MLIEMPKRGIRPDAITFADTGGEKPGTYDFIPVFTHWLVDHGFPAPTICLYQPQPKTNARYSEAALDVACRLGLNMVANETLPSLAFGQKGCSLKWKVQAQEPPRCTIPALVDAWNRGEKVRKFIGFDCTEDHRTFSDGTGSDIFPCAGLPKFKDRYVVEYPLRDWNLDRDACGRIIADAGLPVPPKSACFFCPAMRQIEILKLKREHPDLHALAMEMEKLYREGRHFRGDTTWTVKARHKATREKAEMVVQANDAAGARAAFRRTYDDTARPYRWKVSVSPAVVGLGRNFAWKAVS